MSGAVFFACVGLGGVIAALEHADHGRVEDALRFTLGGGAALLVAVLAWAVR